MARKLGEDSLKYIGSIEDMMDLYEPSHEFYYKKLSKVARKFNKEVPYSYGNFQGYRARIEGAIVRAKSTGSMNDTLRQAYQQLNILTAPQRGEEGASTRTVIHLLTVETMNDWKSAVFDANLTPQDADFRQVLIDEGLWTDDAFWLAFFKSNYFHPIYQDYRDKQASPELFKRLSTGQPSYWVERLMDFYATHEKGVRDFRYKGQKMSAESKQDYIGFEDEENEE